MSGEKLIYVFDDDKDLCDTLKITLESRSYKVQCAHDGETGKKMIEKKRPDLIVLDLKMPKINGYELLNWIKLKSGIGLVPVIVLTSLTKGSRKSDEEWKQSMNVEDFITKPFAPMDLLKRVEKLLS
ncbi:MAG: hypothetical protein Kow0059_09520 [Candidatus Sumerlaeia bacterium]